MDAVREKVWNKPRYEYLVEWEEYPDEAPTWQSEADLEGAKDLVDAFRKAKDTKKTKNV